MTTTEQDVACPKCGSEMWDNRASKKNPAAPDYKCRDRSCDGVIWPPRKGAAKPAARPAPAAAKAPMALGATMPWEEEETGAAPAPARHAVIVESGVEAQFTLYSRCLDKAVSEVLRTGLDKLGGDVAGAIVAAAATLFIQASRK
jgi:hypothetical protein